MHLRYNGPGRRRTVVRRGAPLPPRRKKKKRSPPARTRVRNVPGLGFEAFLPPSSADLIFPELLASAGAPVSDTIHVEPRAATRRRESGLLASLTFHLLVALLLIFQPDLLSPKEKAPPLEGDRDRLVLFMDEPKAPTEAVPLPAPEALLLMEEPSRERLLIPKATRPPPPEKTQDFQNDLPFSEGNTDEFVTDKDVEKPGEEGKPGEPEKEPTNGGAEGGVEEDTSGKGAAEKLSDERLAQLLPKDPSLRFYDPNAPHPLTPGPKARPLRPEPAPRQYGEGGQGGEGGAFEDIRRFLQDKRFHNPEGGLVTGLGNSLYYNDKGANFVPWLRRMLAEVRRNFMMPYSASFLAGHVAVGVSVLRSGDIAELKIIILSKAAGFNNAAIGSLRAADLLPLPPDYPDERFEFILVFWINEQPYEIF